MYSPMQNSERHRQKLSRGLDCFGEPLLVMALVFTSHINMKRTPIVPLQYKRGTFDTIHDTKAYRQMSALHGFCIIFV